LKLSTFAVGYLSTFSNSKILKLRQKKRNGGETGGKPVEDCGVACKEPIFVTNASLFSSVDADPQWKELVDAILEADVSDSKSETYKLQKEARVRGHRLRAKEIFLEHALAYSFLERGSKDILASWGPVRQLTQAAQLLKFSDDSKFRQRMKTSELEYATGKYSPENLQPRPLVIGISSQIEVEPGLILRTMGAKDEELGGIFQLEKVGPAGTLWTVNYNVRKMDDFSALVIYHVDFHGNIPTYVAPVKPKKMKEEEEKGPHKSKFNGAGFIQYMFELDLYKIAHQVNQLELDHNDRPKLTMIFDDSSEALPQPENGKLFLRNPPKDHPITNYWKTDLNTLIDYFRTHHLAPKYVIFNKLTTSAILPESARPEHWEVCAAPSSEPNLAGFEKLTQYVWNHRVRFPQGISVDVTIEYKFEETDLYITSFKTSEHPLTIKTNDVIWYGFLSLFNCMPRFIILVGKPDKKG